MKYEGHRCDYLCKPNINLALLANLYYFNNITKTLKNRQSCFHSIKVLCQKLMLQTISF